MTYKTFFAHAVLTGLIAIGWAGGPSQARAAEIVKPGLLGEALAKASELAGVTQIRDRGRHYNHYGRSYRHHYRGRHFGPYFSFYVGPYDYYDEPYDGYYGVSRCAHWRGRCSRNWGLRTDDYYGCLRYHRCY